MTPYSALTPFPDGVGYMDYAWAGLSPVQRAVLRYRAGRGDPPGTARSATYLVLVQQGLLDAHDRTVTARGQALLDWAEPPPLAARAEPTRPVTMLAAYQRRGRELVEARRLVAAARTPPDPAETRGEGEDCAARDHPGPPISGEGEEAAKTVGRGLPGAGDRGPSRPADGAATPAPSSPRHTSPDGWQDPAGDGGSR